MTPPEKTVLIVDDDTDFVAAVSFYLESNGFKVLAAQDGKEGLKVARMARPDVIILDIIMTERTEGLFAAQEIRRTPELRGVPVILVSSLYSVVPDFTVQPDASWMGCRDFLPKPVNPPQLLEKIRALLEVKQEAAR
ncbi:MAG: two-component system response regulator [Bryobacteraceae bacterium]